jgi:FRG domain
MPHQPNELVANNVAAFLTTVTDIARRWFPKENGWGPWFRGHSDVGWDLAPTLYRDAPPTRGIRVVEDEIRQEFIIRAPSLSAERPQNSWEWYFLMQHSGAPTRLLDWTEGALIALYFAVRNKLDKGDAAVWVLNPWNLNEYVLGIDEVIAPSAEAGRFKLDSKRYEPWLPARYQKSKALKAKLPVAIYPTHFARRISSQRSCFTIHGSIRNGFEALPRKIHSRDLVKIRIPGSAARDIDYSLSVAGIDEITVYPDLDGLGRWLAGVLRDEDRK